jgi:hypothetical protein
MSPRPHQAAALNRPGIGKTGHHTGFSTKAPSDCGNPGVKAEEEAVSLVDEMNRFGKVKVLAITKPTGTKR